MFSWSAAQGNDFFSIIWIAFQDLFCCIFFSSCKSMFGFSVAGEKFLRIMSKIEITVVPS